MLGREEGSLISNTTDSHYSIPGSPWRSIPGSPWREDATGNFDMQQAKIPDRSHLELGCMARRGRADVTCQRRRLFRHPMLANTGAPSGSFMRLGAFRIEWESSAAGRVMLRARNSQRPTASATTRLPALHAFLRADQLQHGLHGPYAIRRGHPAVDGGVSPEQPG